MANDEWQVCWHVSPRVNRASIERHGLDWRMGATGGIAYGPGLPQEGPEMECVFLCLSLDDAQTFVELTSHPAVDVWEVDVRGLSIEYPDDSWPFVLVPIGHERVHLVDPYHEPNP
jgi:hypothetical protein